MLNYIKILSKICLGVSSKKDNSWPVISSATSQLRGASWKLRVKFYPWANTHYYYTVQCQKTLCILSHKFRNYINICEQIDLYMHQNASIYVFCMYKHIQYMYKYTYIVYFILSMAVWRGLG